jgi:hypothetical protein
MAMEHERKGPLVALPEDGVTDAEPADAGGDEEGSPCLGAAVGKCLADHVREGGRPG